MAKANSKGKGKGKSTGDVSYKVTYFAKPGKANTKKVLDLAFKRAKELGIRTILVPSSSGSTGVQAMKRFKALGVQVVVVTLHFGFREKGKWTLEERYVQQLTKGGACIFTGSHGLSGLERSFRSKFGGISLAEGIAYALKGLFGQGTKVAIEIGLMCADSGFAPVDEDVIAFGGTHDGLDTAIVLRPSHMNSFLDTAVREIIAMPRTK